LKRDALRPYLWMLTSSFAFSAMGILAHLAREGCPWQVIALVRSLVPLVLVAAWAKLDGARLVVWGPPVLWMRSIAGSFSLVGTFYALTHMPPSDVFTLSNLFPIWIALLSWPLLGDLPSPGVWVSVAVAVAGVVLVERPSVHGVSFNTGIVLAVSVFIALAMMGLHRLKHVDPRAVVVHFSGVSAVFSLAALLLLPADPPAAEVTPRQVGLLLGVGVTAAVGQFFLTRAFGAGEPARVSVVGLTQVVIVLALDAGLVGNVPDPPKLLGVLLIVGPTAWLILRRTRRRKPAAVPLKPATPCEG
jgi:drug/metabolite transporter (DMT)-like permease